jgi:hypothetical protein
MERMKKQTAVEWFEYNLKDNLGKIVIKQNWELLEDLLNQAKEMEKEQIMDIWKNGFSNGYDLGKFNYDCKPEDADEYYNETFK